MKLFLDIVLKIVTAALFAPGLETTEKHVHGKVDPDYQAFRFRKALSPQRLR